MPELTSRKRSRTRRDAEPHLRELAQQLDAIRKQRGRTWRSLAVPASFRARGRDGSMSLHQLVYLAGLLELEVCVQLKGGANGIPAE